MDAPLHQQHEPNENEIAVQQEENDESPQRYGALSRRFKLEACILLLVFVNMMLGATVVLLQHQVVVKKKRLKAAGNTGPTVLDQSNQSLSNKTESSKTVKRFEPHTLHDFYYHHPHEKNAIQYLNQFSTDQQRASMREYSWRLAQSYLAKWDPNLESPFEWDVDAATALHGLQYAAELGHPTAQFYTSIAHWSGIWPISPSKNSTKLKVMSESWASSQSQHVRAALYVRMAAMAGHEEAAISLAHKVELRHELSPSSSTTSSSSVASASADSASMCKMRLPVAEVAADLIIDRLQATPEMGRGKIIPPTDRHVLYQIHLHGSTNNKFMEPHNQPDETEAALQFYQVRASISNSLQAAVAANTLAQLYHTGSRGVTVNLTSALHWYQVAAKMGHIEAAGQVGDFYLYGLGAGDPGSKMPLEGDIYQAFKWYSRGLRFKIDGCRLKWERKQKKKDTLLCDATCLNGMGVLLLIGVPMLMEVDVALAEQYFELAKEQGKHDAAYNLAMMRMGWKTHWRTRSDAIHVEAEYDKIEWMNENVKDGIIFDAPNGLSLYSLSPSEWQAIMVDLITAAGAGHVQARHRLGKLYSKGVRIEMMQSPGVSATEQVTIVQQDCEKAHKHFMWVVDHASLHRTQRMRRAFNQYNSGDLQGSLRNYLVAAETGSVLAQLNAAFLLEQGTCLGLSEIDCAKASVRLYKSAASRGHSEASLRVGDFYYYGRFRNDLPIGPFGWLQYVLYPEKYGGRVIKLVYQACLTYYKETAMRWSTPLNSSTQEVCPVDDHSYQRRSSLSLNALEDDEDHNVQHDFEIAAQFYAAEKAHSARANFNLGFMYEWGLGLKQDFRLAKRHYDLALTLQRGSDLPVRIALFCLDFHEKIVMLIHSWETEQIQESSGHLASVDSSPQIPQAVDDMAVGHSVPPSTTSMASSYEKEMSLRARQLEVLLDHLFSLESLVIIMLSFLLWIVIEHRRNLRQRR